MSHVICVMMKFWKCNTFRNQDVCLCRAIRSMLADGISDRFTRFITADQFAKMQSYDITGVGLNLCTGSELEEKTDFRASEVGFGFFAKIWPPYKVNLKGFMGSNVLWIPSWCVWGLTDFSLTSTILFASYVCHPDFSPTCKQAGEHYWQV